MKKFLSLLVLIGASLALFLYFTKETPTPTTTATNVSDNDQVHHGTLLLVNREHPVPSQSQPSDIINLFNEGQYTNMYSLLDSNILLSASLEQKFATMLEAANKDGVSFFLVSSGFRSLEEQQELYEQEGKKYALPPGYSEHNLGLSLDIGSSQGRMEEAAEGQWIEDNAWRYGFVLRYPEDKTDITKIEYEPWHIRYVGLPHSAIMHQQNFVLEEYLAYLKEQKTINATVDGKKLTITYYNAKDFKQADLPNNDSSTISGDNMNGIIVTTYQ